MNAYVTIIAAATVAAACVIAPAREDQAGLESYMGDLNRNLKALTGCAGDPAQTAEALAHVAEMQRLVLLAKLEAPPGLEQMPEAERAAYRAGFRAQLAGLLKELADTEIDLLEGRTEAAATRVKEALPKLKKAGHARYMK